jgi:steroid delta-isomerase-like uncharacterized protein
MTSEEVVREFLDAENNRDWERWKEQVAEDVVYYTVGLGEEIRGRDNYLTEVQEDYRDMSDWSYAIRHLCAQENTVMVEFEGSGHFTGVFQGERFDNVPLKVGAAVVFELEDGRITRCREYIDTTGFEQQLAAAHRAQ